MNIAYRSGNFTIDGKERFLLAGEIHYFRIRRSLWEKHLELAAEAGLMAVTTYIPWDWHENLEGEVDFVGETSPEKDLAGWLGMCRKFNLACIVKPGPFILAEYRGAGLPDWFLNAYGTQVKMRTRSKKIVPGDGVNLFHPVFREKVATWYNQIMPFLAGFQADKNGPVSMMQICNEIGVFSWLAHQADYSDETRQGFIRFLKDNLGSIEKVNHLWGTRYQTFEDIELPPDGILPYESKGDRSRDYYWHLFWRKWYALYLQELVAMAHRHGITVPLYHNLPGWIYGSGYEFPVNITMYSELFGDRSELLFGIDHIPEFVSYRNMHDDRIINDIVGAFQPEKPLFAAEFQSGSREYQVVTTPCEMELFYKASLANGLKGWNYYTFAQGKNPPRKGYSGNTFYWFTPVTAEGEPTTAYTLVRKMNRLIQAQESIIINAKRKAEIGVLFYPPYYSTELQRPETGASNLVFDYTSIRRPAYFDGLLRALQTMNIDYDMLVPSECAIADLQAYKLVFVFSTDEMNANDQETIARYISNGGTAFVYPTLPNREFNQQPCHILQNIVGVEVAGTEYIDSPLIDFLGLNDIKCANPQIVFNTSQLYDDQIIARTLAGSACGFVKTIGKGEIMVLGTWLGYDTEGHKTAYRTILQKAGISIPVAFSNNEFLTVRQRFTSYGSGMLFIANYHHEVRNGIITYSHPLTHEKIPIPFSPDQECEWPELYAVLIPLRFQIAGTLWMLHTTSDLLGSTCQPSVVRLHLSGHEHLAGEIVFEGEGIQSILSITIDGVKLNCQINGNRLVCRYKHAKNTEHTLTIILKDSENQ